jgi:hypothetical protein
MRRYAHDDIIQQLRDGRTAREVAASLGCAVSTVEYAAARHRARGHDLPRPMGRPRKPDYLLARPRPGSPRESGDSDLQRVLALLRQGLTAERVAAELGCAVDLVNLVQEFTGVGGSSGEPGPDQVGPAMPAGSAT